MGDAGLRSKQNLRTDDLKTIHNAGSIEKEVRNQAKMLISKLGIDSHNIEAGAAAA
jgi:methylmalonyl-CoA mutase cobalamin-binding subunit